jgi:hypothetical protein
LNQPNVINTLFNPIMVQQFQRYLPTAFDEGMTLLEKVNKVIIYLNQIGKVSNDVLDQWNQVMDWVMSDGLDASVDAKINAMVTDGTLDAIINQNLFSQLNNEIDMIHNSTGVSVETYRTTLDSDDGACIRAAIQDLIITKNIQHVTLLLDAKTYSLKSPITLYANRLTLRAESGAILDGSQIMGLPTIMIDSLDGNGQSYSVSAIHGIEGIKVIGNNNVNSDGIKFNSLGNFVSGYRVANCEILNFDTCVTVGNNSYILNFDKVVISSPNGSCVHIPSGLTNAGERITFNECTFFNSKNNIKQENGSSDVYLTNCSLDYSDQWIYVNTGRVYASHCHFETGNQYIDNDTLFDVRGDGAFLSIKNSDIHVYGTRKNFAIGNVYQLGGLEVNWGGLSLEDIWVNLSDYQRTCVIEGGGRVFAEKVFGAYGTLSQPISKTLNLVPHGSFDSVNDMNSTIWSTDTNLPSIDNTVYHEGVGSANFTPSADNTQIQLKATMNIQPWKKPLIAFWLRTIGLSGTGKNLTLTMIYYDQYNSVVGYNMVRQYNTDMDWTLQKIQPDLIPNNQVVKMEVILDTGNNWLATQQAWIDDFVINQI